MNTSCTAAHGTPPDVSALPLLALWLDPGSRDPEWIVPVYAPHSLSGTTLMAARRKSASSQIDPRQHPWLATDFADIASPAADASHFDVRATEFADAYGLIGAWRQGKAPTRVQLQTMLEKSAQLRKVLVGLRRLGDLETPRNQKRRVAAALDALVGSVEVMGYVTRSMQLSDVRFRPDLTVEVSLALRRPLDLFELMNLQLIADVSAGLRVLECKEPSCRKLFIWSKGRSGPRARIDLRGPLPRFCSFSHYKRTYRRDHAASDTG